MDVTSHEQQVIDYYTRNTEGFYLEGWDPEHLHLGIFDEAKDQQYDSDPQLALADRADAVLAMIDAVVGPARVQESERVLDAGWGVGGTSLLVAHRYGCSVIGLNITEKQIAIARSKAQTAGLQDRVTFQFCDCSQELPFADESVDVIMNIESACHFSNRPTFISECARVLKPHGRIVGQDWIARNGISKADLESSIKPLCDSWFLSELETLESYGSLLRTAGLEVVELEHIEEGIRPNGYIMRMGYETLGSLEALEGLSPLQVEHKEQFRTFAHALLQGHMKVGRYLARKG